MSGLTREEAIERCCQIVGMVYTAMGDYSEPSDCFCPYHPHDSPFVAAMRASFQHSGKTFDYVEAAVREKLARDGFKVADQRTAGESE